MKIAVLSSFPPRKCGIAHLNAHLFEALRSQGHELTTFGIEDSECDYAVDTGSFFGMLKTANEIKRLGIRHVSVQFIISFYRKRYLGLNVLLFLLALRDRRVVVTLHELHHIRSFSGLLRSPRDLYHVFLETTIARLSSGVVLHSDTQVAEIRHYGVSNARRIYLGIETRDVPRKRSPGHHVLFFGMLAPFKGVHLFAGLARLCPDISFLVAGSVPSSQESYRDELERIFRDIPNITFEAKPWFDSSEKEELFRKADLLVLPYLDTYYQSGVAAESGVYNIPVIVPRLGPLSELVDTFGTGVSVERSEPQALAAAIRSVMENYPRHLEGIQRYRNAANWEAAARSYADALSG